jgi:hypothetical protein
MAEQSHRDEMNAAIRAQRERHAAPRTIAPVSDERPAAAPEPTEPVPPEATQAPHRSMFDRLRGR